MKLRGWRGIVGQLVEERGGSVGWASEFTRCAYLLSLGLIIKNHYCPANRRGAPWLVFSGR